jgi:uncharacterized damage-inducible protein DinB
MKIVERNKMESKKENQIEFNTLQTIFRHNLWANVQLFEICSRLNEEQLNSTVIGVYGSIYDTLEHIASAERSYWHRLMTGKPFRSPEGAPKPNLAELQESIRLSGEGLIDIAPRVQAKDVVEVDWDGTPYQIPCAIILAQVINHATEHRAQIMVMLTQLGIQPPELDSWAFFDELDS